VSATGATEVVSLVVEDVLVAVLVVLVVSDVGTELAHAPKASINKGNRISFFFIIYFFPPYLLQNYHTQNMVSSKERNLQLFC